MNKINLAAVKDKIYKYYPAGFKYGSSEYVNSQEYLDRKMKVLCKNADKQGGDHIYMGLCNISKGNAVVNWTEENAGCYEYKILLHKGQKIIDDDVQLIKQLGNQRYDIRVFVSALEPFYYLFVEKTLYSPYADSWDFIRINDRTKEQKEVELKLMEFFEMKGYRKIEDDIAIKRVEGIETELRYFNEATVFDCLFTDMVSINGTY